MSLVNVKQIKNQITWHENQIRILKELMDIDSLLGGKASAKYVVKAKVGKRGRKPKRKRGAVTSAIKAVLEYSSKPVSSGEIRKDLENQGLIEKGSSTIYTLLTGLVKRGAINKTTKGYAISTAKSPALAKKSKAKAKRKAKGKGKKKSKTKAVKKVAKKA